MVKRLILALLTFTFLFQTSQAEEIFWQKISDFPDIEISSIAVDSAGVIFAGSRGNGIYRSDDKGKSWENVEFGENVYDMVIAPDGRIYAATEEHGVMRSNTGGNFWDQVNNGIEDNLVGKKTIRALAVDSSGNLYTGMQLGGMYRSDDGGDNWTRLAESTFDNYKNIQTIQITPDGKIFAGTYKNGIYYSANGGQSWTHKDLSQTASKNNVKGLGIISSPENDLYIFAGTVHNGIFRSTDGGSTWKKDTNGTAKVFFNYYSFGISPEREVYAGTHKAGLLVSTDYGETWERASEDLTPYEVYALTFSSDGRFYAGTDAGIFERKIVLGKLALDVERQPDKNTELDYGEKVDFDVTVLDHESNPLEGADVKVSDNLNSRIRNLTSDENGKISYEMKVPNDVQQGTYYAEFTASHDQYKDSETFKSPVIVKPLDSSKIYLTITPEEKQIIDLDDSVEYTITALDHEDNPIDNASVHVNDSLMENQIDLTTNAEGKAFYTSKAGNTRKQGIYAVKFSAEKGELQSIGETRREIELQFNVSLLLKIDVSPEEKIEVDKNDTAKFTVSVLNYEDDPVNPASVIIIDSIADTRDTIDVDQNGKINYESVVPTDKEYGNHYIYFRAVKDGFYDSITEQRLVHVKDMNSVRYTEHNQPEIKVFPNPVKSTGKISFNLEEISKIEISLIDINGNMVEKIADGTYSTGDQLFTIDASGLPSGAYYLRVRKDNIISIKTLIVDK